MFWLDLEMTGLSPETDVILEIASVITDYDLNVLAEGPSLVINQPQKKVEDISKKVFKMHSESGLLKKVNDSKITLVEAESFTVDFFKKFCTAGKTSLCGNSIWFDRMFIRKYMENLESLLYYRMIDVSSIKQLIGKWYSGEVSEFKKKNNHRAMDDIYESIEELRYYRKRAFI